MWLTMGLVGLGGALGALARFGSSVGLQKLGVDSPWPTMAINILGSLLIGVFYGLALKNQWPESVRHFIVIGVLGGFTTFSAFSYESLALFEQSRWLSLAIYAFGSVILGIAACALGVRCST